MFLSASTQVRRASSVMAGVGSLSSSFCFIFLLLCFPTFVCVQIRRSSGDSDSAFQAHPSTSSTSSTFSADLELQRLLCLCAAVVAGLRSEVNEPLMFDSNTRSEPNPSPFLRFETVFVRPCSPFRKPERSTNVFITSLSPLVVCSKSLCYFNPTGDCNLSRYSPRQGRYYFPTPIVLNLKTKFIGDFGVLHGSISVMVRNCLPTLLCQIRLNLLKLVAVFQSVYLDEETIFGPPISLCPVRIYCRTYPKDVRIFYHLRVTRLTEHCVSAAFSSLFLDEPISELLSHDEATNFTDSTFSVTKSETYRKKGVFQAAARIFQSALGRTLWILGHGPKFVTIGMSVRMGLGPKFKTILKEISRNFLGFKFVMYGLLLSLRTYATCKMGLGYRIESLDSYSLKM